MLDFSTWIKRKRASPIRSCRSTCPDPFYQLMCSKSFVPRPCRWTSSYTVFWILSSENRRILENERISINCEGMASQPEIFSFPILNMLSACATHPWAIFQFPNPQFLHPECCWSVSHGNPPVIGKQSLAKIVASTGVLYCQILRVIQHQVRATLPGQQKFSTRISCI